MVSSYKITIIIIFCNIILMFNNSALKRTKTMRINKYIYEEEEKNVKK